MTYDATGTAGAASGVDEQSTTEQVKERAVDAASQAQDKVREVVGDQVDQHSDQAADKVEQVADDVRAVSESLSDRGQDTAARVVDQGAEYAQQLADYLRSSSSDQILQDVAAFARRQPWAVAAGGLALGFAASRVLRASAANDSDRSTSSTWADSAGSGAASRASYGAAGLASATSGLPAPATSTTHAPVEADDLMTPAASRPASSSTGGW